MEIARALFPVSLMTLFAEEEFTPMAPSLKAKAILRAELSSEDPAVITAALIFWKATSTWEVIDAEESILITLLCTLSSKEKVVALSFTI